MDTINRTHVSHSAADDRVNAQYSLINIYFQIKTSRHRKMHLAIDVKIVCVCISICGLMADAFAHSATTAIKMIATLWIIAIYYWAIPTWMSIKYFLFLPRLRSSISLSYAVHYIVLQPSSQVARFLIEEIFTIYVHENRAKKRKSLFC